VKRLARLRRLLWPGPETNPLGAYDGHYHALNELERLSDLTLANAILTWSKEVFERAETRRAHIESRATTTLTIAGIILALMGGFGAGLLTEYLKPDWRLNTASALVLVLPVALTFAAMVYLVAALMDGITLHSKLIRHTLAPEDLVPKNPAHADGYAMQLSLTLLGYTIENYKANNLAAAILFSIQRKLKYGIVLVASASTLVVVVPICRSLTAGLTGPLSVGSVEPAPPVPSNPAAAKEPSSPRATASTPAANATPSPATPSHALPGGTPPTK